MRQSYICEQCGQAIADEAPTVVVGIRRDPPGQIRVHGQCLEQYQRRKTSESRT